MVKKIKSECGWIVFHLNNNELNKLMDKDYFGNICDSCNRYLSNVYYIPVLNHGMCEHCYNEWNRSSKYYPEDADFENQAVQWIEGIFSKMMFEVIDPAEQEGKGE